MLHKFSTLRAKKESVPLLAGEFWPSPGRGNALQFPRLLNFFTASGQGGGDFLKALEGIKWNNRLYYLERVSGGQPYSSLSNRSNSS